MTFIITSKMRWNSSTTQQGRIVNMEFNFCSLLNSWHLSCIILYLLFIILISICNRIPLRIFRFFVHIGLEYLFTFWACYMLYKEYDKVASMRLSFLASCGRHPAQFTVSLFKLQWLLLSSIVIYSCQIACTNMS